MKNKHIICFDFDDTLIFTSNLAPYRNTFEGRAFVANNPEKIETSECLPGLANFFNKLKTKATLRILTNSSEKVARSILRKHGFEIDDLNRFYANQHKPFATGFEQRLVAANFPRDKVVLIGDSNIDLLTSRNLGIHSILVAWGSLIKSPKIKPSKLVSNLEELEESINEFLDDQFIIQDPLINENILKIKNPDEMCKVDGEIDLEIYSISTYFPTGHEYFYHSDSNEILRFKNIKDYSIEELNQGVLNQYFINGTLRNNGTMIYYFDYFKDKLIKKIEDLNLEGNSFCISAPNSLPEFCYKTDVNQMMVNFINKKICIFADTPSAYSGFINIQNRLIFRIYPKPEAHTGGNRSNLLQYKTLGIFTFYQFIHTCHNILIFDDITTTGSQLKAIATMLRKECRYNGNIIGLTLGKTYEFNPCS